MIDAAKIPSMTPKGTRDVWICRHCKAEKIIEDLYNQPIRCWNSKCRRGDWHRAKLKSGRPRKDAKRGPKVKARKSKKRGK